MLRPYAVIALTLFIVIPEHARCFFSQPVPDLIAPTGRLRCHLNSSQSDYTDFRLCAIRVYTPRSDTGTIGEVVVQNGMWFANAFRRLIAARNCSGFVQTADIGMGRCSVMPYEDAERMTLCICALDNCNQNLETCLSANREFIDVAQLPRSLPTLTTTLGCIQTSDIAEACFEHALINPASCSRYASSHSVLCTIGLNGDDVIQKSLMEENYELFLDEKLHALKPVVQSSPNNPLRDTDSYIYYMYYPDTTSTAQECACTQDANCNLNITSCAPISNQTDVTTSTAPLSTTTAPITSESGSNTTIERYTTANSSVRMNSSATEFPSGTSLTLNFTSATEPRTNLTGTTETVSAVTPTARPETSTTSQVHTEAPSTTATGLNSNIIIGIVAAVVVIAVFLVALVCCQCCRSGRCKCLRRERSDAYKP